MQEVAEANKVTQNNDRALQIAQVISEIGNVDFLSADEFIMISRKLFRLVRFCNCIRIGIVENKDGPNDEMPHHKCDKFNHHNRIHLPYCKCCQTRAFIYYLAWCLKRLAAASRLPEYGKACLSVARIRDRTYGYVKTKSKIQFGIWRHHNAWNEEGISMEIAFQKWTFDLEKLTLNEQ